MSKAPTVLDFMKRFPDNDACLEHLMQVRYGRRFLCPKCTRESSFYKRMKRPAYSCEFCGHDINPMVGTPFERTNRR